MMKPWPCCWIISTYFWSLLSHYATCGPPLCQAPGEEHFIIIAFPLFYYYHEFSLSFTNILVIPSVNNSVAVCYQERLRVLILEDHPRVADKIYVCCLSLPTFHWRLWCVLEGKPVWKYCFTMLLSCSTRDVPPNHHYICVFFKKK